MSIFAITLIMRGGNSPVKQNMVLALSPLVVPVFDLIHVAMFRMANGKHPFSPDMTHVHHRLMQRGFSARLAVTMILCGSVFFTLINSLLAPYVNITLILAIDVVVWSLLGSNFLGSTVGRRRRFMFRRN
jgi:cytochrome c biogenesis protein CcdA